MRTAPCPVLALNNNVSPLGQAPIQWNRIFCAVDFSPESISAAHLAVAWAQEYSANLILFHLVEAPVVQALDERGRLSKYYRRRLERIVPSVTPKSTSDLDLRIDFGSGPEWILKAARKCAADLLVLGTRNVNAPGGERSGRTTRTLLSDAHCPVLTTNAGRLPV